MTEPCHAAGPAVEGRLQQGRPRAALSSSSPPQEDGRGGACVSESESTHLRLLGPGNQEAHCESWPQGSLLLGDSARLMSLVNKEPSPLH